MGRVRNEFDSRDISVYPFLSSLPPADQFGIGLAQVEDILCVSNGVDWNNLSHLNTFLANAIVPSVSDAGPALRAFIDKAKITASATNRIKLTINPGTYNITGTLDFGPYIDVDMRGAVLSFSDNTVDTKVKIGSDSVSFKGGTYLGLNIKNTNSFNNHKYQAGLIGLEITNCQNSHIQIIEVSGFTIGLLLSAFGTSLYTAYNNLYINSFVRCKVCIQIHNKGHGNSTNPAWINENKFFGGNFMPTSDLDAFGSCYGIEFTNSGTLPYLGSNQNIFHSPSFQLGEPTAWSSGKTGIRQYHVYYNPTTFIEYRVTSVGEAQVAGTTAPTHTTGIVADSAGVSWEYVGPCRRSPVFYNNSGGFNRMYAVRWELGFGPFMIAKGASNNTNGSRTRGNIFEIYQKQGVNTIYDGSDECDETCFDNSAIASAFTEVISYDKQRGVTETYNNLHLRAVESSAGVTVPGFENGTATGTTSDKNIASGAVEILYDGLHFKSNSNGIALFLRTDKTKRFRISYVLGEGAQNRGRIQVRCYDSTKTVYTDLQTVGVARAWGNLAGFNATANSYSQTNTASDDNAIATRHDTKWARVWFQGETGTKSIIKTIAIETKVNHMDKNINLVEVENRLPLDFNKRYSNGTPIAGAFLVLGEQITNISGTAGQPLYWTVSVAGYLCKAWITTVLYPIGSLVSNAGTNYRCVTEHTSSAAFATDSANWVSLGTPAVLTASTQTY